ncbi:hypothetical protein AALP_AAs46578U000300 [Arabis alpina]|uniref:Uncharacterized protein n=1 Tax=Arabis alpina TaxID=50452 RepID=A0A087G300_ARAAL|nr:hypothetical protein AALP_AAs46578U000300 [Arabis alpina]
MGKRSFRELASGSASASKAIAPPSTTSVPMTTSTPSTAPDLAPNITSVPSTTPAPSTTSSAKKTARMPSSVVLGMPASDPKAARSSVPLASSRSEETVTCDRRGSEPQGDDGREPKRPRTDPPSPSVRFSQLVFDDAAAAARLFATMVFSDDPYTRVRASSSETMSRAGLKFLAFVKRVGHELKAEIEKQKRRANDYAKGELAAKTERNKYAEQLEKKNKELERALEDNKRLSVENDKLTKKLETAEKNANNSLNCLMSRNAQQFAIAKAKFEVLKGDPQDNLVFHIQREANLDFVKQLLGLFPDRKVPRLEDELASLTADVEAHALDEEYFDKLMEILEECLDVVLLEEMRIDSAGLLKNLMISEDGRMSFAGEDEADVATIAAEDIEAEKTMTGGGAAEMEKTVADDDGAEKAVSERAGLTTLVTSSEASKEEEAHP